MALLGHDIRLAISPQVGEWNGQQDVGDTLRDSMNALGQWRLLPMMANRRPGAPERPSPRPDRVLPVRAHPSFAWNTAA